MKYLAAIFLLLAASAAFGQTVKTLGYNTTNGEVVYSGTNTLTFTNGLGFSTNAAATTRTNLGLGATWLTNTNVTSFRTAIGLGSSNQVTFDVVNAESRVWLADQGLIEGDGDLIIQAGALIFSSPLQFLDAPTTATTRTNLGLGSGITTNITFVDASTNTNSVTISNGIITGWTQ